MIIDTNQVITVTAANQNFSKVTRIADKYGKAVVFKHGKPKYILVNTDDEKIDIVAARVLKKYRKAFEELAK